VVAKANRIGLRATGPTRNEWRDDRIGGPPRREGLLGRVNEGELLDGLSLRRANEARLVPKRFGEPKDDLLDVSHRDVACVLVEAAHFGLEADFVHERDGDGRDEG